MPGIALAQAWRRRSPRHEVLFFATGRPLDAAVLGRHAIPYETRFSIRAFLRFWPDVVVGLGGRASAKAVLAGRLIGARTAILEQNVVPGRANRLLAPWVGRVYLQFAEAKARLPFARCVHTGSPLRRDLAPRDRVSARLSLGLEADRPTLVVIGGSQGARILNEGVPRQLGHSDLQILHLAGRGNADAVRAAYNGACARVMEFTDDMAAVYSAADFAVSRAGALAIHELAAFGVPTILVPFAKAMDDHQTANAMALARAGAAVVVREHEISRVSEVLTCWQKRETVPSSLRRNLASFARTDAAERILDDLTR